MAISKVQTYDLQLCDGTNTAFQTTLNYNNDSGELVVSLVDTLGTITQQILNTDYTLEDTVVTFTTAPTVDYYVLMQYESDYKQSTEFKRNHTFNTSDEFNGALDKLALTLQTNLTDLQRAVVAPIAGTYTPTFHDMASQNTNQVTVTGGSVSGLLTPLAISDGGLNAIDAATARTSLGLGNVALQGSGTVSFTGGTIAGTVVNINGTTEDTNDDPTADYIWTYDASAGTNKKVKLNTISAPAYQLINDTAPALGGNLIINGKSAIFTSVTITDVLNDTTLAADSAVKPVTEHAAKTYTDSNTGSLKPISIISGAIHSPDYTGAESYDWFHNFGLYAGTPQKINDSNTVWGTGQLLIVPFNCTISNLYAHTVITQNTSGTFNFTARLRRNTSIGSNITASLTDASFGSPVHEVVSNNSDILTCSAGDIITFSYILSSSAGSASTGDLNFSAVMTPT